MLKPVTHMPAQILSGPELKAVTSRLNTLNLLRNGSANLTGSYLIITRMFEAPRTRPAVKAGFTKPVEAPKAYMR
jgi:hypothetical protein